MGLVQGARSIRGSGKASIRYGRGNNCLGKGVFGVRRGCMLGQSIPANLRGWMAYLIHQMKVISLTQIQKGGVHLAY